MGIYNVDKIQNLHDTFVSTHNKYNNAYYSDFKNSYIFNCGDPDISRMKKKLDAHYSKICRINKRIKNIWEKYINDLKGIDKRLAGQKVSLNDSTLTAKISKLPQLNEYKVTLETKINSASANIGTVKGIGWAEDKTVVENLAYVSERTKATITVAGVSVVEGLAVFGEGLMDLCSPIVTEGYCQFNLAFNENFTKEKAEEARKNSRDFVAKEHVKSYFDKGYENSPGLMEAREKAYGFETVRSVGNEIGEVVGAITISTLTQGAVNPAILYGMSKAGNHIEENFKDTNKGYFESIIKGSAEGAFDGLFFAAGMKGDAAMKSMAASAVNNGEKIALKKASILFGKTLYECGCSVAQDCANIMVNAFFSEDKIIESNGNVIKLDTFDKKMNYYYEQAGGINGIVTSMATACILSFASDVVDVSKISKSVDVDDVIKSTAMKSDSAKKASDIDVATLKKEYDELMEWKSSGKFKTDEAYYRAYKDKISGNDYKKNMERISELEKLLKGYLDLEGKQSSSSHITNDIESQLKKANETFDGAIKFTKETDIALYFEDPKQFLFQKCRELKIELDKIYEPSTGYRVGDLKEEKIYKLLRNHLNKSEIKLYKGIHESGVYSDIEKARIYVFTAHAGPYLSAYNRHANIKFQGRILDGTNIDDMFKYVNLSVAEINRIRGTSFPLFKSMDEFNQVMDNIVSKQTLKDDIIVYRTVDDLFFDGSKLNLDSLKPGDVFNDSAHTSASVKEVNFQKNSDRKVQLEICAKKGTPAAYIESFTGVGGYGQQEILFGRNSSYRILGYPKIDKNGVYHIKVELLSNNKYIPKTTGDSIYAKLFNKNRKGRKVSQIISDMQQNGMMTWYNKEVDDMIKRGLYDGPKAIAEHDITHVKNVLLYTMNMGNDMNLSAKEMQMIVDCAKYHDVGVVNAKTHTNHSILSAEKIGKDLASKYDVSTLKKMQAIVEFHELDDIKKINPGKYVFDDSALKNVCNKYGIVKESDIDQIKKLGSILKDADALDRTRFPGNIDVNYFRNKEIALEYLNASYDIRESISTTDLSQRLKSGSYSKEMKNEITMLVNKGYPYSIIDFALKYYKNYYCSSITEYVEKVMSTIR